MCSEAFQYDMLFEGKKCRRCVMLGNVYDGTWALPKVEEGGLRPSGDAKLMLATTSALGSMNHICTS